MTEVMVRCGIIPNMHPAMQHIEHRPYALNPRPWLMQQDWIDLAFLHWRIDAEKLRAHVPSSLELEEFDGSAWIGVVPFEMTAGPRGLPVHVSEFPELNVRTYVRRGGKFGVYFFSLDAGSPLAVWGARTFFHLPYFNAKMRLQRSGEWFMYDSRRTDARGMEAVFRANYRAVGDVFEAAPDSLEYFLTERYCLLLEYEGKPYCCDIHHDKWKLQRGEVQVSANTMLDFLGIDVSREPPHVLFSKRMSMVAWPLERM